MHVKHVSAEFPVKHISCSFHIMKAAPQFLILLKDTSKDRKDDNDVKNVSIHSIMFEETFKVSKILKGAWTGESKERRKNRGSQASGHDAVPFAAVQEWVAAKEVEWHVFKVAEPHD